MEIMKSETITSQGHIRIRLSESDDELIVLRPRQLTAFQGYPGHREDQLLSLAGIYRKKRWLQAKLKGPAECVLGLPLGFRLIPTEVPEESHLLYDFRHVLYYTSKLKMKSKILPVRAAFITKEWVRMKFTGPGYLGIVAAGPVETLQLQQDIPLYVEAGTLISYPEDARVKLSVYGNSLASQHMRLQWELYGTGPVLVQTAASDPQWEDRVRHEGFIRRTLREVLPFGGVYIK
jgi:hypothetical protein